MNYYKRYVAKCCNEFGILSKYELSPRFDDPIDCLHFIKRNKHLIFIEHYLSLILIKISRHHYIENIPQNYYHFRDHDCICVYDLMLNRFCNDRDFDNEAKN